MTYGPYLGLIRRMEPGVVVLFFLQFESEKTLSQILVVADGFILKIEHSTYKFFFVGYQESPAKSPNEGNSYKMQDKSKMKTSATTKLPGSVGWVQKSKKKRV